jgi:uncharacterized protein YeeX (DUF496 family)
MNETALTALKHKGKLWVHNMMIKNQTRTKPGSISYLLYGEKPSEQSINIKFGRFGEFLAKEMIRNNSNLELLECGVQVINNKMKDVDLLFMDNAKKIIYYRELKGNIELDTEKLPATIAKCNEILAFLKSKYVDYYIDYAILNWSIYNRRLLTAGLSNIKLLEKEGLRIEHMGEFCDTAGIAWGEEDYYSYFREIGGNISDSAAAQRLNNSL